MKEIFLLTKVLLKGSKTNTKKTNTSVIAKIFTFLVFLFVYLYLAGMMGYISYQAIESLRIFNQEKIFLNICFVGMLVFSIFQSIFTSLNVLFFSKDLDALLPLPIKPYKIVMAKLICIIISQYLMYFVVILPIFIVYGYLLNLGAMYYIYLLLILLSFPIMPVSIISLLLTIIMKFTKIIKNRETLQYITAFLTIILIIGIQSVAGMGDKEITNQELANNLLQTNESIEEYLEFLPNIRSAVDTLNNYENIVGIKNFGIFILESIMIYITISFIISRFYIKTVTSLMSKGTKINKKHFEIKEYKRNAIWKTYLFKEIKTLVRNPIFFMQCVIPPFLFPIIIILPIAYNLLNQSAESIIMLEFLSSHINTTLGVIIVIEILELFYIFNFATITSVSRDGSDAKIMKYLPIDLSKQVSYKTIIGIFFNTIPLIYIIIVLKLLLNINTLTLIYIILLATIINIFNNLLVIIVDLKNPKTDWMTEYAVVKQNLNMFYQMVIIVTQMGLLFLSSKITNLNICFITLNIIFIVFTILTKLYINKNKYKLFKKIY